MGIPVSTHPEFLSLPKQDCPHASLVRQTITMLEQNDLGLQILNLCYLN